MTEHDVLWVSGATGAWGREICRQALQQPIKKLILFSRGEHRLVELVRQLNDNRVRIHLGDVRDTTLVRRSLDGATILIHGAALKRVESGAMAPEEMASVNVDGTKSVIDAALATGSLKKALYISSDKACEPTTFYGATKFLAEELWRGANVYSPAPHPPWFAAARFGNVLGSTGSVLEVWRRQRALGEPLTMRDPLMTRFVMTQQDAVARLLRYAENISQACSLYIPNDIPAVRIGVLAEAFAGENYHTTITGQRHADGEKLHERLVIDGARSNTARQLSVTEMRAMLAQGNLL